MKFNLTELLLEGIIGLQIWILFELINKKKVLDSISVKITTLSKAMVFMQEDILSAIDCIKKPVKILQRTQVKKKGNK